MSPWKTSRGWSATAAPRSPSACTGTRSARHSPRAPKSWTTSLGRTPRTAELGRSGLSTEVKGAVIDTLQAARADHDAVVKLIRDLVRIPSRGGIDPYQPV